MLFLYSFVSFFVSISSALSFFLLKIVDEHPRDIYRKKVDGGKSKWYRALFASVIYLFSIKRRKFCHFLGFFSGQRFLR